MDVSPGNPATMGDAVPGQDRRDGSNGGHDGFGSQAHLQPQGAPTIYDVARAAGVSIASVSRVLNGRRNPLPDTRERVERAVAELGFIPDAAARTMVTRLKEVVGVVIRRPTVAVTADGLFEDEEMSLQFPDLINRGIEVAAQRRDFNLLVSSVGLGGYDDSRRIFALARKSDGLILHDRVLDAAQLERLSRQLPVVTLAGTPTPTTVNVDGDNRAGMKELARHLVRDHGYRSLAYLGGHVDSPDNIARCAAFGEQVAADGAQFVTGPQWQGNYLAAGGARVIEGLLAERRPAPPGDRLRKRPDRARRGLRADAARHRGAGRGRHHRLRRHPGRAPPPATAHHRAPADHRPRRDRVRNPLLDDHRRRPRCGTTSSCPPG